MYGKWKTPAARSRIADVDDLGVEDLRILSPTRSYIACMSSSGREALLDAGDDRQLGGPLVGLGQQTLRLIEQAGVLEGDAQARGERAEKPLVRLVEGVSLDVLPGR